jgi:hypothetical protein
MSFEYDFCFSFLYSFLFSGSVQLYPTGKACQVGKKKKEKRTISISSPSIHRISAATMKVASRRFFRYPAGVDRPADLRHGLGR